MRARLDFIRNSQDPTDTGYWAIRVKPVSGPTFELRLPDDDRERLDAVCTDWAKTLLDMLKDKINSGH